MARFLTRQIANHVTMSHAMPAVGCTMQIHTVPVYLDMPGSQVRNAPSDIGDQEPAAPAESQHHQSEIIKGKLPQASAGETSGRYGWPERGHTPAGRGRVQQLDQQRQVTTDQHPGRGTPREQQSRSEANDLKVSHSEPFHPRARSQRWQPPSNRSDMQSQRSGAAQGNSNFRGQPDMTGPASGPRPAFVDRSGSRPAFVDRSKPDQGSRPAFIDRSGAANRNDMPNQRPRQQDWQTNRPGPQSQQGRPAPGNSRMPLQDAAPDPDDPDQQAFSESRRRGRVRKVTPSSSRTERAAPGNSLRGGGPAKGTQFFNPAALVDDIEAASGANDQEDAVAENFLERQQYNPRGVPASWKDEIQDIEVSHHTGHHEFSLHHVMLLAAANLIVQGGHCPVGIAHCIHAHIQTADVHHQTTQKHYNGAMLPVLFAISSANRFTVTPACSHTVKLEFLVYTKATTSCHNKKTWSVCRTRRIWMWLEKSVHSIGADGVGKSET